MMVYEEEIYTAQNLSVCKTGLWKKIPKCFFFNQNATLSKMDTPFWTTLYYWNT